MDLSTRTEDMRVEKFQVPTAASSAISLWQHAVRFEPLKCVRQNIGVDRSVVVDVVPVVWIRDGV